MSLTKDDVLHMMMACKAASLSVETTKVGCLLVYQGEGDTGKLETWWWGGYNTLSHRGRLVHAERVAFMAADADIGQECEGLTAYITKTPCLECCELLASRKIDRLVTARPYAMHPFKWERSSWHDSQCQGLRLLEENGVAVDYLDTTIGSENPTVHPAILLSFNINPTGELHEK